MGLLNKLSKFHRLNFNGFPAYKGYFIIFREKSLTVEIDALDDFTTQLVQRKADKWKGENVNIRKYLLREYRKQPTVKFVFNLKHLDTKQIDLMFQEILDENDENKVISLITECVKLYKLPSSNILLNVLHILSQQGDIENIKCIQMLCKEIYPDLLKSNSNFDLYLAQAIWLKGNVPKAIEMFQDLYKNDALLRRRLRLMLKYLISDAIYRRSEAVLFNILDFTEELVKEYNDFYLLTILWQTCFLSEWYTDQCIALKLLEHCDGLRKAVIQQIPYVVFVSLKYHKTEPVYKLLEILIQYSMKKQYSVIVTALFDYKLRQGDLLSCSEIHNWAAINDVALPSLPVKKEKNSTTPNIQLKF